MLRSLTLAALLASSAAYADEVFVVPQVTDVTVYLQGASVTRQLSTDLPAGQHTIRLPYEDDSDGPPRVSGPEGVTIGAMRLVPNTGIDPISAETPVQTAARARVEAAKDALQALEDKVVLGQARVQAEGAKNDYLRSLTGASLTGIDAESARAASNMVADELAASWTAQYEASIALRVDEKARDDARKTLTAAEAELRALAPPSGPINVLELSVTTATAGPVDLTIESLTYGASWVADYALDLTRGEDAKVAMERKVVMQQTTDALWSDVNLTLSTANPFAQVDPRDPYPNLASIAAKGKGGFSYAPTASVQSDLSRSAQGVSDIIAESVIVEEVAVAVIEGLSVTYDYPTPISLAPTGEALILALDDFDFDAREFNRAVPRLDDTAFLMAEFTNSTPEPFLPGQMSVSRDGVFVGRSAMELVPAGGKAEVSFGTLEGLRLEYKLLDNDTGDRGFLVSSSTRVQQMEFSVENLLDKVETVQTLFSLPFAEQEDLEVSVSTRPNFDETDFEQRRGVSVWTLEVGPGETKTVRVNVEMNWPEGQQLNWRP